MTTLWVPETPRGFRDVEGSAIAAPAVAAVLPLHAMDRVNWLLAHGASQILSCYYPSTITAMSSGRIYHLRSADCSRLLVVALVEKASGSSPSFSVTPSGGAAVTLAFDPSTTATTRWGSPGWQLVVAAIPLSASGLQYHEASWSNIIVRSLAVYELPRDLLDTAVDTMVAPRSGSFAGLEAGRMICDGSVGSVADILAAIVSARDATKRHGGAWLYPTSDPWSVSSKTWANLADGTLGTSGFGFQHTARRIRSATSTVKYDVRVWARYAGNATGDMRIRAGASTVDFTALTGSWAWHSPDSAAQLSVDATATDTLIPEGITDDLSTTVECASVQYIEA
jgi:hypothetical protein